MEVKRFSQRQIIPSFGSMAGSGKILPGKACALQGGSLTSPQALFHALSQHRHQLRYPFCLRTCGGKIAPQFLPPRPLRGNRQAATQGCDRLGERVKQL